MRTSGVAFALLTLRSRLSGRFACSDDVCGALQATGAIDLSDVHSRRILIIDPASSCCFNVRRPFACTSKTNGTVCTRNLWYYRLEAYNRCVSMLVYSYSSTRSRLQQQSSVCTSAYMRQTCLLRTFCSFLGNKYQTKPDKTCFLLFWPFGSVLASTQSFQPL